MRGQAGRIDRLLRLINDASHGHAKGRMKSLQLTCLSQPRSGLDPPEGLPCLSQFAHGGFGSLSSAGDPPVCLGFISSASSPKTSSPIISPWGRKVPER